MTNKHSRGNIRVREDDSHGGITQLKGDNMEYDTQAYGYDEYGNLYHYDDMEGADE